MVFKDGDKVKVRDAVSVDVLIYDMFRVVEEDDCRGHRDTAIELMNNTLAVMVNEDEEDDNAVCVLCNNGFSFYISAELLELVEENDTVADYLKEILTRIKAIERRLDNLEMVVEK